MRKILKISLILLIFLTNAGYTFRDNVEQSNVFSLDDLSHYQKKFLSEEIEVCAANSSKTYMDYRATTDRSSRQYQFIHEQLTVDEKTGFLYDGDGFIGVALGSFYGEIGDRFYFTLASGVVLPLVKCEEKADRDTDSRGCYHTLDNSVIEFVIDKNAAMNYFGRLSNDYILNGNYNNYHLFNGEIVLVEKVLDEVNPNYLSFHKVEKDYSLEYDVFNYGTGF